MDLNRGLLETTPPTQMALIMGILFIYSVEVKLTLNVILVSGVEQ